MRRLALTVLAAAVALLALAPGAAGYALAGQTWPGRPARIAYAVAAPASYAWSIAEAAAAWNRSGARVRLVRVASPARAQVAIRERRSARRHGVGRAGFRAGAAIALNRCAGGRCLDREAMAGIVARELGRVLGLGLVRRGCATMSDPLWAGCRPAAAPERWQYRCRLLQRDDLRGAVARYGGRVRLDPRTWCDRAPPPPAVGAPRGVALRAAPDAVARLSWTFPTRAVEGVEVRRRSGRCPTSASDPLAEAVAFVQGRPGRAGSAVDDAASGLVAPGRLCYGLASVDRYGRRGAMRTVVVQYPGPPPVPPATALELDDRADRVRRIYVHATVRGPALPWIARAVVVRRPGATCPTSPADPLAFDVGAPAALVAGVGRTGDETSPEEGIWCYAAFLEDRWGRRSAAPRTAVLDYVPPRAAAATGVSAEPVATPAAVRVTWSWPAGSSIAYARIYRTAGSCPTALGAPGMEEVGYAEPPPGGGGSGAFSDPLAPPLAPGTTWCYTVVTHDQDDFRSVLVGSAVSL